MQVEIIKNEEGRSIGWSIKGETPEEKLVVNTIRNLQFFGLGETAIRYAGRSESDDKNHDAGKLKWKQKKYINH